jgi:hypothetical protein
VALLCPPEPAGCATRGHPRRREPFNLRLGLALGVTLVAHLVVAALDVHPRIGIAGRLVGWSLSLALKRFADESSEPQRGKRLTVELGGTFPGHFGISHTRVTRDDFLRHSSGHGCVGATPSCSAPAREEQCHE